MAGRRGALIVLEGVDRAGKTTQCCKLVEALCDAGQRAQMLRFPERSTEIGKLLSSYLEKKSEIEAHAVHLLFSANRWEQVPLIKEKLSEGVTLVVDRYAFSGVAYTSAKKLQLADAAKREGFGCELYENQAFQKQVLQRFYQLMEDPTLNWKRWNLRSSHSGVLSASKFYFSDSRCFQKLRRSPRGNPHSL
ncbi:thymidylate kinase isoform X3 [Carlito syrichta]|uniref:dTMP kinase n=1 Tax=Carlito syrichta TaxID=1868482 RepID=A0A1U7SV46_CARSF|nr:thymidylate kinase isoform X3 [Carlito syrichta]